MGPATERNAVGWEPTKEGLIDGVVTYQDRRPVKVHLQTFATV